MYACATLLKEGGFLGGVCWPREIVAEWQDHHHISMWDQKIDMKRYKKL